MRKGDLKARISYRERLKLSPEELYELYYRQGKSFIFEKLEEGRLISYMGSNPLIEVKGYKNKMLVKSFGEEKIVKGDSIENLEKLVRALEKELGFSKDIFFLGGFSYEASREIHRVRSEKNQTLADYHFILFKNIAIYDYEKASLKLIEIESTNLEKKETKNREQFRASLINSGNKEIFKENVEIIKEKIALGLVEQVVISDQHIYQVEGDKFSLYKELKKKNPSPYNYYIDFGDYQLLGASPEMLVKIKEGKLVTCPIAGTRPRGKSKEEDKRLIEELLNDPKELMEHKMLVDLARMDMESICKLEDIEIKKYMEVEKFSHVIHLVSMLEGELKEKPKLKFILRKFFPASTLSGSPRKEALELIEYLENNTREFYGGAVGFLALDMDMDFAIVIRTILFIENLAYVQAGAGIVEKSDPDREYEEVLNKMMVLKDLLGGLK